MDNVYISTILESLNLGGDSKWNNTTEMSK